VLFSAIAAAFFGPYAGDVILSLYLLGYTMVFIVAIILRKTLFRGRPSPFVIEFPVYQEPSLKVAAVRMWDRGSLFFKKAGSVILIGLLVIGLLTITDVSTFTFTDNPETSIISAIGHFFQPVFTPLGWDWRLIVAAIFGFIAKEIVLGASAMLYGVGEAEIASKIASMYNPIDMFGYLAFIQLYIPCIVTVAAIKQETGSWKWTIFAVVYGIILAYVVNWLILVIGHGIFG
jgi:ferrous iron transport protein B